MENSCLSWGRPNVLGCYYIALCLLPSRSSHVVDQDPRIIVCLPLHVATEHGVVFFSGCLCCVCSLLSAERRHCLSGLLRTSLSSVISGFCCIFQSWLRLKLCIFLTPLAFCRGRAGGAVCCLLSAVTLQFLNRRWKAHPASVGSSCSS